MSDYGRLTGIKNYTLTSSFAAINVDADMLYDQIQIVTSDGSEAQIRFEESGTDYYPISQDLGTAPVNIAIKRESTDSDEPVRLFDAKGTATLCIIFWKNES